MTSYRNPWHKPNKPEYGPQFYQTDARAEVYNGFSIYQRIQGHCWDVVKDGVFITQRSGINGARQFIDEQI